MVFRSFKGAVLLPALAALTTQTRPTPPLLPQLQSEPTHPPPVNGVLQSPVTTATQTTARTTVPPSTSGLKPTNTTPTRRFELKMS